MIAIFVLWPLRGTIFFAEESRKRDEEVVASPVFSPQKKDRKVDVIKDKRKDKRIPKDKKSQIEGN